MIRRLTLVVLLRMVAHPVLTLLVLTGLSVVVALDANVLLVPPAVWLAFGLASVLLRRGRLPGRAVRPVDEPDLAGLVGSIAEALDVKAPLTIRVLPVVDASLAPTRLRGSSAYALLLGLPLLRHLDRTELSAVIAHELSHRQHTDDRPHLWLMAARADAGRAVEEGRLVVRPLARRLLEVTRDDVWGAELAADADAARLVGSAAARAALRRTDVLDAAYPLLAGSWDETLEDQGKYLSDPYDAMDLALDDPLVRAEVAEVAALAALQPWPLSGTHPSTPDRLAALPDTEPTMAVPSGRLSLANGDALQSWCVGALLADEDLEAVRFADLPADTFLGLDPGLREEILNAAGAADDASALANVLRALEDGTWREFVARVEPGLHTAPGAMREALVEQVWRGSVVGLLERGLRTAGWSPVSRWVSYALTSPEGVEVSLRDAADRALRTNDSSALRALAAQASFEPPPSEMAL